MSNDEEKIDDFISLWKKKKTETSGKPSAIGDTLDKINELEKKIEELKNENADLKDKILSNIELLSKTEKIIKDGMEEKKFIEVELNDMKTENAEFQVKNAELRDKITTLEDENSTIRIANNARIDVLEKALSSTEILDSDDLVSKMELKSVQEKLIELETELHAKDILLDDFKSRVKDLSIESKIMSQPVPQDLQSKVQDLNDKIVEYDNRIEELTEKNKDLSEKLFASTIAQSGEPTSASKALDALCQDLQSKINKLKTALSEKNKIIAELKNK